MKVTGVKVTGVKVTGVKAWASLKSWEPQTSLYCFRGSEDLVGLVYEWQGAPRTSFTEHKPVWKPCRACLKYLPSKRILKF